MKVSKKGLRKMYRDFNRKWFRNRLPKNIEVRFVDLPQPKALSHINFGLTHFEAYKPVYIYIWSGLQRNHGETAMTLLHEMVHVSLPYTCNSHGPYSRFEKEMVRLAKAGAFNPYW